MVAEMNFLTVDNLILLMSFPCNEYYVSFSGKTEGFLNCRLSIRFPVDRGAFADAGHDFIDDTIGIFVARIIGCHDRHVAQFGGDPGHLRALRAAPITAAAEYCDDPAPAARSEHVAHRRQRLLKRVGCVRVVDHRGPAAGGTYRFEPAANGL